MTYPIQNTIYYTKLGGTDLIAIYKLCNNFTEGTTVDYFVQFREYEDQLDFTVINTDDDKNKENIINTHYSNLFNTNYYGIVCNTKNIKPVINYIIHHYSKKYNIDKKEITTKLGANII